MDFNVKKLVREAGNAISRYVQVSCHLICWCSGNCTNLMLTLKSLCQMFLEYLSGPSLRQIISLKYSSSFPTLTRSSEECYTMIKCSVIRSLHPCLPPLYLDRCFSRSKFWRISWVSLACVLIFSVQICLIILRGQCWFFSFLQKFGSIKFQDDKHKIHVFFHYLRPSAFFQLMMWTKRMKTLAQVP